MIKFCSQTAVIITTNVLNTTQLHTFSWPRSPILLTPKLELQRLNIQRENSVSGTGIKSKERNTNDVKEYYIAIYWPVKEILKVVSKKIFTT